MRLTLLTKLVLFTVLPVVLVYALLFSLGLSHVRDRFGEAAQTWLVEHARHQAARLALGFSQVPALAEGLGDLILAEPEKPQALLYAHLIDGLRRTPLAAAAAVGYGDPWRGALMRRGEPAGLELPPDEATAGKQMPGWQRQGERLRFIRPIYRQGRRIGASWVAMDIGDVYAEIARQRGAAVTLFLASDDSILLPPGQDDSAMQNLARLIPAAAPTDEVQAIFPDTMQGSGYWLVSTRLPGFPWRLVAITPTETALQPARREATLLALALLLSLGVIVLGIGLATRRITRPLADLDASVQQIARGDFAVSPQISSQDELGDLAKAIGQMARYITERENLLRSSHQVLEQRVAERTSALQQSNTRLLRQIEETRKTEEALRLANEQAQQASRAKSEFLSNMSHELRTPLHGVLGYAQILRRDPAASPGQRESLEAIERCGQHLLTLINDILDLTKIEAGQMQVDIQPTDLRQLFADVRMIVAQRAETKGLTLELALASELPACILTDPVKLKQILLNLLGNAVKFTPRGSVSLRAGPGEAGQLQLEVVDTGVGIAADKIDSIFAPFNQARDGQAIDGTGLGLAINQRLIGLLGGEALTVESRPGVGSRFRFRIPCVPADDEHFGELRKDSDRDTGKLGLPPDTSCTVMVVDELAESRDLLSTLLRYAECTVESFADTASAMARLREKAFDLALVDVRLVDAAAARRAAELAAGLRANALFASPRLVAVSAHVFPEAERVATRAGFDAFLAKPFGDAQLFGLVEGLLDIRFEARPTASGGAPDAAWPAGLAAETARKIHAAIDLGDVASLFQLAEELTENPAAPGTDVDNIALMARLFDFDGLRRLAERLQAAGQHAGPA